MFFWFIRINDGPLHEFETRTPSHADAAHATYAVLPYEPREDVTVVSVGMPYLGTRMYPGERCFWHFEMLKDDRGRTIATMVRRKRKYLLNSPRSEAA